MDMKIRKATEADSELLAWAMMESSRAGKQVGLFDLIFTPSDDAQLLESLGRLSMTETKSYCHYSNFIVAEVGGVAAGVLCGYEPRIATHEIFSQALDELGYSEGYEERIAAYLLCKPEIGKQTWVLDFMEEKPEFQSLEIVKELINKSLLTARLKGYRQAQTMIEIGSIETQMAYEKLGFSVQDEKRADLYRETFGRAGIKRLAMSL